MGVYVSLIVAVVLTGCAMSTPAKQEDVQNNEVQIVSAKQNQQTTSEKPKKEYQSAADAIARFKAKQEREEATNIPPIVLPPVYEEVSVFDQKSITFAAQNAKFSNVLYSISKLAGLNLIIDKNIDTNLPITLSVEDAKLKDVLDILMQISGCYYEMHNNILHIRQYMHKTINIPYIHATTSFKTELGGDVLNSANNGGGSTNGGGGGASGGGEDGVTGMKGKFALQLENPKEMNDFYAQLEKDIQALLSPEGKYTLNRFSGTLDIYDKKANVEAIEKHIDAIKSKVNKQILIEAQILEVVLNDDHALGVSWQAVADNVVRTGDRLLMQQTLGLGGAVAGTVTYTSSNFNAIISALDESGDVDTLSNPRIKVLNGQSAIISSGKLVPFWEKEVQVIQGTGGSASNTQVTYNRRDVLHGLSLGVTPTIMDDGKIMLNVIPVTSSIEKVVDYKDELGRVVASAPILNVKEAGTVIYAKDNDLILIGGLISNTVSKKKEKVPYLSALPFLGSLFTRTIDKDEKRELVILIRLKVIQ